MRRAIAVASLFLAAVATGCGQTAGEGGASSALCAFLVVREERTYESVHYEEFTEGAELGTAFQPACDDTPNDPEGLIPAESLTAYAVRGFDPAVALAVGNDPDELQFVAVLTADNRLPAEVEEAIEAAR
ncbi:DUF6281 family protein [Streptomyces sp. N35]|uniref:DUF6281 family protein n=1 Tax=Streptomyces sp. N35 TaxID=2795730 RepID=UPI0018F625B0|nr:DUF6281 family protein [Streptomyces sp. N35]